MFIIYLILGYDIDLTDDVLEEFRVSLSDEQKSYKVVTRYHKRKEKCPVCQKNFKRIKAHFLMHKETYVFRNDVNYALSKQSEI